MIILLNELINLLKVRQSRFWVPHFLLCQPGGIQHENIKTTAKNFIFLVEIKKDSLLAAGLILELKGYKITVSGKSENPIKKILELENSENPVDLIISDVPVPLLEKIGLIDISGKLPRKLPGILITDNTNRKTRQELENKGFHVIEKPVDPEGIAGDGCKCVIIVTGEGEGALRAIKCLWQPGGLFSRKLSPWTPRKSF